MNTSNNTLLRTGTYIAAQNVGLMASLSNVYLYEDHIELVADEGCGTWHIENDAVEDVEFATFDELQTPRLPVDREGMKYEVAGDVDAWLNTIPGWAL